MRLLGFPPTSSEDILASGTQARQTQKAALTEVLRMSDTKLNVTRDALKEETLERTREGHRQSDEHWNRFKGNVEETSERLGGAHIGFSERIDTILN